MGLGHERRAQDAVLRYTHRRMKSAAQTQPDSGPAPWAAAWQRIPGWLKDVALVALLYFCIQAYQGRDAPSGQAPALASLDPAGAPITLEGALGP
ncbi:MAG: hypothetical protein OEZ06_32715 [Myxococcales bacterium]|nr:hypothetical protein [Myxococcales bacterium]